MNNYNALQNNVEELFGSVLQAHGPTCNFTNDGHDTSKLETETLASSAKTIRRRSNSRRDISSLKTLKLKNVVTNSRLPSFTSHAHYLLVNVSMAMLCAQRPAESA